MVHSQHMFIFKSDIPTTADCFVFTKVGASKNRLCLFLSGNCLGMDGCKALKDSLESMNMAEVLGTLR